MSRLLTSQLYMYQYFGRGGEARRELIVLDRQWAEFSGCPMWEYRRKHLGEEGPGFGRIPPGGALQQVLKNNEVRIDLRINLNL